MSRDDLKQLILPAHYVKTTAAALRRLEGKLVTARKLGDMEVERTIRIKRAWHRYGSPRQLCIEAMDDDGTWIAETVRAFCEADGLSRQETDQTVEAFRKMIGPISGNLPQV